MLKHSEEFAVHLVPTILDELVSTVARGGYPILKNKYNLLEPYLIKSRVRCGFLAINYHFNHVFMEYN